MNAYRGRKCNTPPILKIGTWWKWVVIVTLGPTCHRGKEAQKRMDYQAVSKCLSAIESVPSALPFLFLLQQTSSLFLVAWQKLAVRIRSWNFWCSFMGGNSRPNESQVCPLRHFLLICCDMCCFRSLWHKLIMLRHGLATCRLSHLFQAFHRRSWRSQLFMDITHYVVGWFSGNAFGLALGRSSVRISDCTPIILNEVFVIYLNPSRQVTG